MFFSQPSHGLCYAYICLVILNLNVLGSRFPSFPVFFWHFAPCQKQIHKTSILYQLWNFTELKWARLVSWKTSIGMLSHTISKISSINSLYILLNSSLTPRIFLSLIWWTIELLYQAKLFFHPDRVVYDCLPIQYYDKDSKLLLQ